MVVLLNFILIILGVLVKIVRLVLLIFIRLLFIERDIEKWVEILIGVIYIKMKYKIVRICWNEI